MITKIGNLSFCFFFLILAQEVCAIDSALSYRAQAMRAYNEGFWNEAMEMISNAIDRDSLDPLNYYWRSKIRKDQNGKLKDLDRAVQLDPSLMKAFLLRGDLLLLRKEYDKAMSNYNYALQIRPSVTAFLGKGLILLESKEWEEATSNFLLVLDLEPKNMIAIKNMAYCYMKMNDNKKAIRNYWICLNKNKKDKRIWNFLGALYFKEACFQEALLCWENVSQIDPKNQSIQQNIGLALLNLGLYRQAEIRFRDILALNPEDFYAKNHLGNVLSKQHRDEEAIRMYSQAIDLGLTEKGVYYNRGIAYKKKGMHDKAIKDFLYILDKDHYFFKTHFLLGEIYYEQKEWEKAIKHFQFFVNENCLQENEIKAWSFLADAWMNLEHYEQSILVLSRLIALEPNMKDAYFQRAVCFTEIQQDDDAIKNYEIYLALNPKSSGVYYNLGNIFYRKKHYKKAISFFNKAAKLNPYWKDIYYNRSVAKKAIGDNYGAEKDLRLSLF